MSQYLKLTIERRGAILVKVSFCIMMNSNLLLKITQSILIDPLIKEQIIGQRDSLTPKQQQMIEEYVLMWSNIEWDLFQKALDNNPKLQSSLKHILQKYKVKSLSSLGWDAEEADKLINHLSSWSIKQCLSKINDNLIRQ